MGPAQLQCQAEAGHGGGAVPGSLLQAPGQVTAGRRRGREVEVQQPPDRRIAFGRRVFAGGEATSVLADQVVEAVTAAGGFGDHVLVVKSLKVAFGGGRVDAVEGGGRPGVGVGPPGAARAAGTFSADPRSGPGDLAACRDEDEDLLGRGVPLPGPGSTPARRPAGARYSIPHVPDDISLSDGPIAFPGR